MAAGALDLTHKSTFFGPGFITVISLIENISADIDYSETKVLSGNVFTCRLGLRTVIRKPNGVAVGWIRPYLISGNRVAFYIGAVELLDSTPPDTAPIIDIIDSGPHLNDCVFPTLSWNLISILIALIQYIGCILHNIVALINWIVGWILHFPDHLDAWISRLFGVDPSLPFFDEILKKIDVWISGKFGVDPALPFWEELVKRAIAWLSAGIDEAAGKAIERLR